MHWDRTDIPKIFLCLLAISVMLGLCMQLTAGKADSAQTGTLPAGRLLSEEEAIEMENNIIQIESGMPQCDGGTGEN